VTSGTAFGLVAVFTLWLICAARDFHVSTLLIVWFKERFSRAGQMTGP
jgi:hypothetical protein